jgi:signal transduction histidine kinase
MTSSSPAASACSPSQTSLSRLFPAAIERNMHSNFSTWAALGGRLLGTLVFAWAAFASPRRVRSHARVGAIAAVAAALALAAVGLVVAFLSGDLPTGVEQSLTATNSSRPRLDGNPAIMAGQVVGMFLCLGAAFGFTRRAERTGDDFMLWLGIGGALVGAALLNYALYPSLYSDYVYTGDAFTLLFYLVILGGSAREIGRQWRSAAKLVAFEERRRIARNLHDSLAQELAYITRNLTLLDQEDETVRRLARSAERAWHESRRTIFALSRPLDVPLVRVLSEEAEAVAAQEGARVTLSLASAVDARPEQREVIVRVACEAIRNAVRHGGASLVHLELARETASFCCACEMAAPGSTLLKRTRPTASACAAWPSVLRLSAASCGSAPPSEPARKWS